MGLGALLGPDPLGDHRGGYTRFELWITKATQNDKTPPLAGPVLGGDPLLNTRLVSLHPGGLLLGV